MSDRPASILMCVGKSFYELHEMVEEYQDMGISKRLPITSIPDGLIPYKSKLFVAHPDAIIRVTVDGKTLLDLALDLADEELLTADEVYEITMMEEDFWFSDDLNSEDPIPEPMLTLALAYSRSQHKAHYIGAYGVETCMGVVGYAYMDRLEYVVRDGEETLPEELAHLDDELELTSYTYED